MLKLKVIFNDGDYLITGINEQWRSQNLLCG